jgi:translation elongation factor P/translation initiation factor 5A
VEESAEEKMTFLRNHQIQKQFMDYYYDKDKIKKEYKSEEKQKLLENKNITNTNNGTTKLTTQNTSTKNL